ncbi:MAG: primosomal protein N', partial [Clostridia bacterium]|nr:primosomal protein N' [Clostridia bacterium]
MTYAQIIVDLSAEAVDRQFSYAVPEGMDVRPGQLVAVPFGPRTLEGFVVSLSDVCDLPPEKVRPVLRIVREEPVILPDMLALAEWMHGRYLCNLVDALRLMLPAEMRGGRVRERTTRYARLNLTEAELEAFAAANPRAPKQIELLRRLRDGDLETAAIAEKSALKALVEKGAAVICESERRRTPNALRDGAATADPELLPEQRRAVETLTAALE